MKKDLMIIYSSFFGTLLLSISIAVYGGTFWNFVIVGLVITLQAYEFSKASIRMINKLRK